MYSKKLGLMIAGVIGFLIIIFAIGLMVGYNGLVDKDEKIDESISQIKIRLTENDDKIGQMIEIIGDLESYSVEIYTLVTQARADYVGNQNSEDVADLGELGELQTYLALEMLQIIEDNNLVDAGTAYNNLLQEVSAMQSAISQSRRDYNQAVLAYNRAVRRFPGVLYANMFGFDEAESYWDEPAE
jgi:LemA protein